jgi:hypothetical protein
MPLDRSFVLVGQRYTVDSHVFSLVTHDRVQDRMMPNPLDVAFAALKNDAALPLLAAELEDAAPYAQGLGAARALVDAHGDDYWEGSIYTRWLGALRQLSPEVAPEAAVPRTAAWQHGVLSTLLASWAELRHDTVLYSKQSYSSYASCEFPDAYVDPYPELYAQLGRLAASLADVAESLPDHGGERVGAWATAFQAVTSKLEAMANDQQTGTPHSQELLDFINDAVSWSGNGCTAPLADIGGWLFDLYLDRSVAFEEAPIVADVHTQPTTADGVEVGRVLHVGTGDPRLMVVTVETCEGPRAYVGLASAYGELVTDGWTRLDDSEWARRTNSDSLDPSWMSDVFAE